MSDFADGPVRRRLRVRYQDRHGLTPPTDLVRESLTIGATPRTWWTAPAPARGSAPPPLLVVLHGAGGQGPGTASLTGFHHRGPAAGFCTVFPDGAQRVWNDSRVSGATRRRADVDDVGFLQALLERLVADGRAHGDRVYLAGISNGALMAEHIGRHGLLPVAGLGLVAGPGTETSRAAHPRPARTAAVALFSGTADPLVPYRGGPIGPLGRLVQRRGATDRGLAVAAETAAAEWAAVDGIDTPPVIDALGVAGDLPVTRLSWTRPDGPGVVLHRVEGGGHTWPGAAQYLPARFVGPVARALDATGILLATFRDEEARACGAT